MPHLIASRSATLEQLATAIDDAFARWDLRVTEVFERRDQQWVRVHRHADPLVDRHHLDEMLSLLA